MRIFFSDLDGTLLNENKEISPATKEALNAYIASGGRFVVSTGRPIASALYVRDQLGLNFPSSYMSTYNGCMLYDNTHEQVIYRTGVDLKLVPELMALADRFGLYIQGYQDDFVAARSTGEEFEYYTEFIHMTGKVDTNLLNLLEVPSPKMLAIALHERERLDELAEAIHKDFDGILSTAHSDVRHLEIYPSGNDKGEALKKLCEILEIPVSESMAAGDEENDIPMLRAAGVGIAMANARDSVKAAADEISANDNDHDGLVPYLTVS